MGGLHIANEVEAQAILRLDALARGEVDPVQAALDEANIPEELDFEAEAAWEHATMIEGEGYRGPRGVCRY